MAVLPFRVGPFARDIFLAGTKTFDDIPLEYVVPVKQHAAQYFTKKELDNALEKEWITQEEYDDVMLIAFPQQ